MSEIAKFHLRIPSQSYNLLKELAELDNRSINNYLTKLINDHIEENQHRLNKSFINIDVE